MESLLFVLFVLSPVWIIGGLKLLDWHTARSKSWNEVQT